MTLSSRAIASVCAAVWLVTAYGPLRAQQPENRIPAAVMARAQASGAARVIVNLRTGFVPEGRLDRAASAVQRASIADAQDRVLARLAGHIAAGHRRFTFIPAFAATVDAAALDALRAMPDVASVEEDVLDRRTLAQSVPQINAPAAWSAGYTGAGWAIAILDTGVQTDHPFLAGKTIAEACYSNGGGGGASLCPGGALSSTAAGSARNCDIVTWGDGCGHGTHVAGIAAGRNYSGGPGYSGVAPDASIVPIQVFTGITSSSGPDVASYTSDQLAALQRVYALATGGTRIASVNMSLGGGQYADQATCDASNASRKDAIDNLRSIGVAVVVASGNDGLTNALSAPGCISSAVSVGSVNDSSGYGPVDAVSDFSNTASFLNLLAPGIWISSSYPTNGFATLGGTSMAAPHVAGAWALMKERKPAAAVNEVLSAFTSTGVPVQTPGGYTTPRIDVGDAVATLRIQYDSVDEPSANATLRQPFSVNGWSLNMGALSGTGIDAVNVYAIPRSTPGSGIFLGAATYGAARTDVAAVFGAQYTNAGWSLTVSGLSPGTYDLNVYARSSVTGTFSQVATIANITVVSATDPRISVDTPANGASVSQPFLFGGWAVDLSATSGAGMDAVHVYAFPNPGSGAAPIFVGVASYGISRPDVGAVFGSSSFSQSGWQLEVSGLPAGSYLLAAYGHDAITGTFAVAQGISVTISTPGPVMNVDTPAQGASLAQGFSVSGWAIDRAASSGSGVDAIHVWAYPDPGSGAAAQFVGAAPLGISRGDVGAIFGSHFTASGFSLTVNTLAPGHTYRLYVYAHSSVTGEFNQVRLVDITLP